MKTIIALALSALAFSVTTAAAGNPNLCAKDGWASAQSASGQSFASMKECAKAREVYRPSVTLSPTAVGTFEEVSVLGAGFHPDEFVALTVVLNGVTYSQFGHLADAAGSVRMGMLFGECDNATNRLVVTLTDAFGVHASAGLTLC